MNEEQIREIVQFVRQRLAEFRKEQNVQLELEDRDYRTEEEWLYLSVYPSKPGIRASDYAEIMAKIEKELRANGFDNVLLVPTVDE